MSAYQRLLTLINEFHDDMRYESCENGILLDNMKEQRKLLQIIFNMCSSDEYHENRLSLDIQRNFELAKDTVGGFDSN